jgi:uncharacterized secreted protein with C-terminal beta-propeller domain
MVNGTTNKRRDYTTEIIKPTDIDNRPLAIQHSFKPKKNRKIVLGLIIFIIIIFFVFLLQAKKSESEALKTDLASLKSSVHFPLYIPVELPDDFTYKQKTLSFNEGTVIYQLSSKTKGEIFISQQQKPATTELGDFHKRFLKNEVNAISTQGKAVAGTRDSQIIGSLETKETWILINTNSVSNRSDVSKLLSSLSPL